MVCTGVLGRDSGMTSGSRGVLTEVGSLASNGLFSLLSTVGLFGVPFGFPEIVSGRFGYFPSSKE